MGKIIPLMLATILCGCPASAMARTRVIITRPLNAVSASVAALRAASHDAVLISGLPAVVTAAATAAPIPVKAIAAVPAALATKGHSVMAAGTRTFGGKQGMPAQPADLDHGFDGRSFPSAVDRTGVLSGQAAPAYAQLPPSHAAVTPDAVRALMVLGRTKGARKYARG